MSDVPSTNLENKLTTSINPQNSFHETLQEFVKEHKPFVAILTPCYGSQCYTNYVHCILKTSQLFAKYNIPLQIEFCRNDSLVSRARNNLIAKAMHNTQVTHIMFIDADITWDPNDILKLLVANKSLNGGLYPLKNYNWSTLVPTDANPHIIKEWLDKKNNSVLKNMISDDKMIQLNLLKYNANFMGNSLTIENNLTTVRHIATGLMMIKRNTLEQMFKAFPSTKYVDDVNFLNGSENDYAYALFDCGVEDGHYFSEDWLFCHRWTKMGGLVHLDISINLTHTGVEDYVGSFVSSVL